MGKLTNSFSKGLKIASHVALGCLAYGVATGAANFHPDPTTVPGMLWYSVGISLTTGAVAAAFRWANYNPSKVQ